MFRIKRDPSSGSSLQCLVKINSNGSISSVDTDVVCVMAAYLPVVCVCVCVCTAQCREALCSTHTHIRTHAPRANMLP